MAFWKKIFKSKYTGAEIDAAIAKAGTVPAVTAADAGKALVVNSEGKIIAGAAGTEIPTVELTEAEIIDSLSGIATALNAATDNFQYAILENSDSSVAASVGAKIAAAYAKGNFANLSIFGVGNMPCYIASDHYLYTSVSYIYMASIQKNLACSLGFNVENGKLWINLLFAIATEYTPK